MFLVSNVWCMTRQSTSATLVQDAVGMLLADREPNHVSPDAHDMLLDYMHVGAAF